MINAYCSYLYRQRCSLLLAMIRPWPVYRSSVDDVRQVDLLRSFLAVLLFSGRSIYTVFTPHFIAIDYAYTLR